MLFSVTTHADDMTFLKPYLCTTFEIASRIAEELKERLPFGETKIEETSLDAWDGSDDAHPISLCVNRFKVSCTKEQLQDAIQHAKSNLLKINSDTSIFCCATEDIVWQAKR